MKLKKQVCIIVDAFSTGKHIAKKLSEYQCIHIQSSDQLSSNITSSLMASDFVKNLIYKSDVDLLLNELKNFKVKLCVPGSESGVELADVLSEKLGLPGNGTELSKARRNKYLMTEAVAAHGLKTVRHIESSNLETVLTWAKTLDNNDYPVVLKPIDSASGDGVYFCANLEEITYIFEKIINAINLFGIKNHTVLAQSFNRGQEYIVNTVSWEGKHFIAEIWRVNRKPETAIYDTCEVVYSNESEYEALVKYTFGTLDALGIRYGAGTTELKYTLENGPVLIECAARLMGAAEMSFSRELFGYSQLSLMLEAYLEPHTFLKRLENGKQEQKTPAKYGLAVLLISDASGTLQTDLPLANYIENKVSTFFSYDINADKGSKIAVTVDMLSSPGTVYLISTDKEALARDYKLIRQMEAQGVYRMAVLPATRVNEINRPSLSVRQNFFGLGQQWGLTTPSNIPESNRRLTL